MRDVHLRNLDLNLIHPLHALLEECHVTRAAKRSFLSQSAMSRALERLRDTFGDPLLVRNGRGYQRTVRGERVLRELESLMPRLEDMVRGEKFDPAQSQEVFRVAMSDHASMIVLPSLLASVRKTANHVKLEVSASGGETYADVEAGRIDTFLCAEEAPPSLESEMLFSVDFVCLVGAALPVRARRLTMKQYLEFEHVLVELRKGQQALVDRALSQLGAKRRVAFTLPFFVPAIFAIAQTDLFSPCHAGWQRSLRPWLVCASWRRLVRSSPFRISWHGIHDSRMNRLTNGFVDNCGRLFEPSEQFKADIVRFGAERILCELTESRYV